MSFADYQGRSFKVTESICHVLIITEGRSFKVTESICHVLITMEEVLKLRSIYVMS